MKVGNVIKTRAGLHVVTKVKNGVVLDTMDLEGFIAKNALVKVDGCWFTIQDIIEQRCDMYLQEHPVINETK